AVGYGARVGPFVVARFLEPDAERLKARGADPGRRRGDRAGIHAAAQEHPERHIADHLTTDRCLDLMTQSLGPLFLADTTLRRGREVPVPDDAWLVAWPHRQQASRRELGDAGEDREGRRHVLVRQVSGEAPQIELARDLGMLEQRAELG